MIKVIPSDAWGRDAFPQPEQVKVAGAGFRGHDLTAFLKRASHPLATWVRNNPPKPGEVYVHLIAMGATEKVGCFPPGTEVRMGDASLRKIENVKVGDEVVTHTGNVKKVTSVFNRSHTGPLIEFDVQGQLEKVRSTAEHPYYVIRREQITCSHDKGVRCTPPTCQKQSICAKISCPKAAVSYRPEWIPASDIRTGDFVLIPMPGYDVGKQAPQLNPELARLMGFYLAEGSLLRGNAKKGRGGRVYGVSLSFGIDEFETLAKESIEIVDRLMDQSFYADLWATGPYTCEEKSTATVHVRSVQLTQRILKYFGVLSDGKFMSGEVFQQAMPTVAALIGGYVDGDGHQAFQDDRYTVRSTSRQLLLDLQWLLTKFSVPATLCGPLTTEDPRQKPYYQLSFAGQYGDFLDGRCRKYRKTEPLQLKAWAFAWNGYICQPVRAVCNVDYEGPVYNFEVDEDHSYVVGNGIAVHNCNRNADGYRDAMLLRDHPTFEKHARWFMNHANGDINKSYGIVPQSMYDSNLGRVELIAALNSTKEAADRNGGLIAERSLHKLASQRDVDVSMSCKIPFDVCVLCKHKAKHRGEYCKSAAEGGNCTYGGCFSKLGAVYDDGSHQFVDNPYCTFFDISDVSDTRGADRTAFVTGKVAGHYVPGGAELAEMMNLVAPEHLLEPAALAQLRCLRKLAAAPQATRIPAPDWATCVSTRSKLASGRNYTRPNNDYDAQSLIADLALDGVILPPSEWLHLTTGTPRDKCASALAGGVNPDADILKRRDLHDLLTGTYSDAQRNTPNGTFSWLSPTVQALGKEAAVGVIFSGDEVVKVASNTPERSELAARYLAYQAAVLATHENSSNFPLLLADAVRHTRTNSM